MIVYVCTYLLNTCKWGVQMMRKWYYFSIIIYTPKKVWNYRSGVFWQLLYIRLLTVVIYSVFFTEDVKLLKWCRCDSKSCTSFILWNSYGLKNFKSNCLSLLLTYYILKIEFHVRNIHRCWDNENFLYAIQTIQCCSCIITAPIQTQ